MGWPASRMILLSIRDSRTKTTERLFQLISANISLITEQISFILLM